MKWERVVLLGEDCAHRDFLAPGVPTEDAPRFWKPRPIEALAEGFLSTRSHIDLPSIDSSRSDLRRWTDP